MRSRLHPPEDLQRSARRGDLPRQGEPSEGSSLLDATRLQASARREHPGARHQTRDNVQRSGQCLVGIVKVQPGTGSWRQTRCADVDDTSIGADAKPCVHPRSSVGDLSVADMEDGHVLVPALRHAQIMTCQGCSGDEPPAWASVAECPPSLWITRRSPGAAAACARSRSEACSASPSPRTSSKAHFGCTYPGLPWSHPSFDPTPQPSRRGL